MCLLSVDLPTDVGPARTVAWGASDIGPIVPYLPRPHCPDTSDRLREGGKPVGQRTALLDSQSAQPPIHRDAELIADPDRSDSADPREGFEKLCAPESSDRLLRIGPLEDLREAEGACAELTFDLRPCASGLKAFSRARSRSSWLSCRSATALSSKGGVFPYGHVLFAECSRNRCKGQHVRTVTAPIGTSRDEGRSRPSAVQILSGAFQRVDQGRRVWTPAQNLPGGVHQNLGPGGAEILAHAPG